MKPLCQIKSFDVTNGCGFMVVAKTKTPIKRRPKTQNTDLKTKTQEKLGVNTQKRGPKNEDP